MWVRPEAGGPEQLPQYWRLFSKEQAPTPRDRSDSGFSVEIGNEGVGQHYTKFARYAGANKDEIFYGELLEYDTFSHIVFTLSGKIGTFYLNGLPITNDVNNSFELVAAQTQPDVELTVGNHPGGHSPFKGAIDELAIYKSGLSAGAVCDHFRVGRGLAPGGSCAAPAASPAR